MMVASSTIRRLHSRTLRKPISNVFREHKKEITQQEFSTTKVSSLASATLASSKLSEWTLRLSNASKAGDVDMVEDILAKMKVKGATKMSKQAENSYRLRACVVSRQASRASEILQGCDVKHIDEYNVRLSLLACHAAGDAKIAESVLAYTRKLGIETSPSQWDVMLAIYAEIGAFPEAISLLKRMEVVYRIDVSAKHVNRVLKAACRCKSTNYFLTAKELVDDMKKKGVVLDAITLSTLIQCAVNNGCLAEATEILECALPSKDEVTSVDITTYAFHHIMHAYGEMVTIACEFYLAKFQSSFFISLFSFSCITRRV